MQSVQTASNSSRYCSCVYNQLAFDLKSWQNACDEGGIAIPPIGECKFIALLLVV